MLVKELIARLQKVDGDLPVSIDGCDIHEEAVTVAAAANGGYYFVKEYGDKKNGDLPTAIKCSAVGIKAEINLQSTFDIFLEYPEIEVVFEGRIDDAHKEHIESLRKAVLDLKKDGGGIV